MMKKLSAIMLCLASILNLAACGEQPLDAGQSNETEVNKLKVSVTFNAMKEFVTAVGGEKVEVTTIIPDGTEPHDFEPKAQDMTGLSSAQVFVYNGLDMESWVQDAIAVADNKNLITVEASKGVTPITNTDAEELAEHGQYDPHAWLSLKNAETEAKNICDALVHADPANKEYFEANYSNYVSELEKLYQEYAEKFGTVSKKSIVTGHAAFAYLCRDFGLQQNSVEDVFAEGEPSAQQLTKLVTYCKENHVTTIFAEEMASPEVSKTLADEVGANVKTIYTIESAEDNKSYLERMQSNLSEICNSLAS